MLDEHLKEKTVPEGFTRKASTIDTPNNELLRNFTPAGCQDLNLDVDYSDLLRPAPEDRVPRNYLQVLTCNANFQFRPASPYYYPPFIAGTDCANSIKNQTT